MTKKRFPIGTVIMTLISVVYLSPLFIVLINSFKLKTTISATPFVFPNADSFCGFDNYIRGMTYGDYPFWKSALFSLVITVLSTAVILLFTSMTAWFISRVDNLACKVIYYLCVFSMIVPFQMVMYTLSKTADTLHLSNPLGIVIVYLGFGAGLAVFMFCGFVKSIPLEIEEAANIDGCGPLRTFFGIVLPIMKPALAVQAIFTFVGSWNNYFVPALILQTKSKMTVPILIATLRGADYMNFDMGKVYMMITVAIVPIILVYLLLSKYIIAGVTLGGVKE